MYFSATQKCFLPAALQSRYAVAGNWPADATLVGEEVFKTFSCTPPAGTMLGADADGLPAWVDATPAVPTFEQACDHLSWYVQQQLDKAARDKGYDDIKSAVTYADEPSVPKFQAEGQAFRAWRSLVWEACAQWVAGASGDVKQLPKQEEIMGLLPALKLP